MWFSELSLVFGRDTALAFQIRTLLKEAWDVSGACLYGGGKNGIKLSQFSNRNFLLKKKRPMVAYVRACVVTGHVTRKKEKKKTIDFLFKINCSIAVS